MGTVSRYHPLLVALHWLLAFLIFGALFFGAVIMSHTPNSDPNKIEMLQKHMGAGFAILGLMVVRLIVRTGTTHPPKPTTGNARLDLLARVSHRVLYVAVFAQVASGLVMALQTHLPQVVYAHQGSLPTDFWSLPARYAHYGISRVLMFMIGLHIAGALYHTLVLRDGLLRRMAFGRRRIEAAPPAPGFQRKALGARQ